MEDSSDWSIPFLLEVQVMLRTICASRSFILFIFFCASAHCQKPSYPQSGTHHGLERANDHPAVLLSHSCDDGIAAISIRSYACFLLPACSKSSVLNRDSATGSKSSVHISLFLSLVLNHMGVELQGKAETSELKYLHGLILPVSFPPPC
jgi:hypothetical protein